ncbi:MAG: choice-of-anchor tandem repeat GloVer-containing protein [Bryobacteraceae bacterium]
MERIYTTLDKPNRRKRTGAIFALSAAVMAAGVMSLSAQTFTTLASFDYANGEGPEAAVIQGTDGNFYGTTQSGGTNGGVVFRMTPSGTLTAAGIFGGATEGVIPFAGLVQATNGDFYGTTYYGGLNDVGTVYKFTLGGALTTLYSFCSESGCADGEYPYAGLIQATNGDLYGTTSNGATGGTIYKIAPGGAYTTVYRFCALSGCPDGKTPIGGIIQATSGDFYGTTYYGGANGLGTVYRITPGGTLTTLHSFCAHSGCPDGQNPYAVLVQGTDGDLYGTTQSGGANAAGTIFKITPGGKLTTLYSLCSLSDCADGDTLDAGLIQGTDGNFYGTTIQGGANRQGTAFRITPDGALTTLYAFCSLSGCADGNAPLAGLFQGTDGSFYGTTDGGGTSEACGFSPCGTVFRLAVGLGRFVQTEPTSGQVGTTVKILGNKLAGATSVRFNGAAAAFTVVRPSEITATVPAGATTGTVEVVTPGGTLLSNVQFRVP